VAEEHQATINQATSKQAIKAKPPDEAHDARTCQRGCVGKGWIQLHGALEERHRRRVVALEAEAVAHHTPGGGIGYMYTCELVSYIAE